MIALDRRDRTFNDILVGEQLAPLTIVVTQEHIAGFQEFLGHFDPEDEETSWLIGNNLHIDEEYSRKHMFGGVVGDGHQTGQYLCQVITESMPWGTLDAGYSSFDFKFTNPTRPGDVVTVTGTVVGKSEEGGAQFVHCEVKAVKGENTIVAVGSAKAFVPRRTAK